MRTSRTSEGSISAWRTSRLRSSIRRSPTVRTGWGCLRKCWRVRRRGPGSTAKNICKPNGLVVVSQTDIVGRYAPATTDEAGNADHGGAVEFGRVLHPRDSGSLSGEAPAGVYHYSDHCLPTGRQGRAAARQEDRQRPY